MAKRVLFLISDTGGGHRASALALGEALQRLHGPTIHWREVDLFVDYAHWPLSQVPRFYRPLTDRHLWLWRLFWRAGQQPVVWRLVEIAAGAWHAGRLSRLFADYPADLVVSVHPLLNHAPLAAVRRWLPDAPFATVVTDLATAHPVWYAPGVDLLCAPCLEVRQAALAAGVPAERVRLAGLPISLRFSESPLDRGQAKALLGLPDRPLALITGGGEGMGAVEAVADAVCAGLAKVAGQAAVICGRNAALWARLSGKVWPVPVRVVGFVDNMPLWMWAADCLVTKAGPGTIAEALACGLPMVLSGFIAGQEEGNVGYVLDHGVGGFCSDPLGIAHVVQEWLEPGNPAVAAMQQKARALARPRAALKIAEMLSELLPA
jgi:1,2-diacylglycerol 3-beta-galactosyltransferase